MKQYIMIHTPKRWVTHHATNMLSDRPAFHMLPLPASMPIIKLRVHNLFLQTFGDCPMLQGSAQHNSLLKLKSMLGFGQHCACMEMRSTTAVFADRHCR